MAKKTPGLYRRNGLWHIDKQRVRESVISKRQSVT
jgi:hypothetical protein